MNLKFNRENLNNASGEVVMFGKFLDPKNDIAFRKIFGSEKNKDILIHFLNDVIDFQGLAITNVTFLKTIQDPEIREHKTSIVDILCEDQKGNRYVVEMQVAKEKGFEKRAQCYASKAYSSQMTVQGQFQNLKAVIFLAITDFLMFPNKKDYKSDHIILDKKTYENDLKDFSFTFLELPKFRKRIHELSTTVEMWMYFFKYAEETTKEDLQKLEEHVQIKRAYEELDRFSWNEVELRTYDQREKYEACYIASMEQKLDEGIEIGLERGLEQGEKIGIEKGEKIGVEKGEKQALLKVAKNLLAKGISVEEIEQSTGLSQEEIASVQERVLVN